MITYQKWMFVLGIFLFTAFAFFGFVVLGLESSWGRRFVVEMLADAVSESGWHAKVEKTEGTLPKEIILHNVTLESPRGDILTIGTLETQIFLLPLLRKEIYFSRFYADRIAWTPGLGAVSASAK